MLSKEYGYVEMQIRRDDHSYVNNSNYYVKGVFTRNLLFTKQMR